MATHKQEAFPPPPKQIYVIEDHSLIQKMVAEILSRSADLAVCGVAATAADALAHLRKETVAVDLALVDISLPDMTGIALVETLLVELPTLPCLMLSGHQEIKYIQESLAAGARGYIAKGNPREIASAIRQVLRGEIYLSDPIRNQLQEMPEVS